MANGHSVIPLIDKQLADKAVIQFLADEMIFVRDSLPRGRFPTLSELRDSIHEFAYSLEEAHDWYVTSEDDFTEIWFSSAPQQEDIPTEFWFRRGGLIVLDIAQSLTKQVGSLIVASHSGTPVVLLVPDTIFPVSFQPQSEHGFVAVISRRLPIMVERLADAPLDETLFILSQIHQALQATDYYRHYEFFQTAQQGLIAYRRLLGHEDTRVRSLAFELVATFRERFYEHAEAIRLSITNESDPKTKERMIDSLERLIVGGSIGPNIDPWTKSLLDVLRDLSDNANETPPVRLAAAHLLARAQPGLLTPAIRTLFIAALVQPEQYGPSNLSYYVIEQVLKSVENLLLNHRIEILSTALPQIPIAQDAHDVLRALMDHVFFGAIRATWMSSLPDTQMAERSGVDESRFREGLSRTWLYPANPTKLTASELLPTERIVLEMVLGLDVPWMVLQ